MRLLQTLLLLSSLGSLAFAQDVPARLDLSHSPGDDVIAQLLWARSPDLVAARAKMATAQSDVVRSGLWPNPSLDASWNTIPVGRTNPPNLSDSLNRVPNYAFSLSSTTKCTRP